ncbi:phytanoyl-CoA dioxygenase domain containing 1 [Anticarsia gemmatalis]|uniref:phytanoyl-CoA dioxygenase domain containing 1 n=1 Tax=Anticarsia gemmatalis TaxID=129554 RepID=UPI003F7732A5
MPDTIRNQLERDGYVILEDFLSRAECDELLDAGRDLARNLPSKHQRTIFTSVDGEKKQMKEDYFMKSNDKISYFFEDSALDANGDIVVDPKFCLNKIGHALHLLHPIFRCYTYSERVKTVCRELGFRVPCVAQSMYIYKNPGVGGEVIPHQDITYLHTEPIPPIGFWIALEDATIQNSCLWVVRGSHKSGVHRRLVRSPDKDGNIIMVYDKPNPIYPESSFLPLPVCKGTCILIHGNVVHKSAHNRSDMSRHAYTFHIIEKQNNKYSPDNWLQEGENAPFQNVYTTPQIV